MYTFQVILVSNLNPSLLKTLNDLNQVWCWITINVWTNNFSLIARKVCICVVSSKLHKAKQKKIKNVFLKGWFICISNCSLNSTLHQNKWQRLAYQCTLLTVHSTTESTCTAQVPNKDAGVFPWCSWYRVHVHFASSSSVKTPRNWLQDRHLLQVPHQTSQHDQ